VNKLDVIIVTYKRKFLLEKCLNSLLNTSIKEYGNIFVILNGKEDFETEKYLKNIDKKYEFIKYFVIDKVSKNKARNIALKKSKSEILYFLDDDVYFDKDNIKILLQKFENYKNVNVVGGPNLTPPNSGFLKRIQGYILSSYLTSFSMSRRYKLYKEDVECDDKFISLCNLGIKRKVFGIDGIDFNESLVYNEENYIVSKLKEKGGGILFSADLRVFHERRKSFFGFLKQIFYSGFGRGQLTVIFPKSFNFIYVIPAIFLLYCFSLIFVRNVFFSVPLIVYFFSLFLYSIILKFKERENIFVIFLFPVFAFFSHISYGIGFVLGYFYEILKKK